MRVACAVCGGCGLLLLPSGKAFSYRAATSSIQLQKRASPHCRRSSTSSSPFSKSRKNGRLSPLGAGAEDGDGEEKEGLLERANRLLQTPFNLEIPWKPAAGGFAGGLAAAVVLIRIAFPQTQLSDGVQRSMELFDTVLYDLEHAYVSPVDVPRLTETALVSMLRTLDPYTEFEGKTAAADMKETVTGRYGGVGLVISSAGRSSDALRSKNEASPIRVVNAFEGYAFDEGMRPGDTLLAVDGVPVNRMSIDKVRDMLRGPPESSVVVRFRRDAPGSQSDPQEVELKRQVIRLRDLKLSTLVGPRPADGIGYIQLSGFSQGCGRDVAAAIEELQLQSKLARAQAGAAGVQQGLSALILDLRGNPGGLLDSAVEVAALFLDKGSGIVSAEGRSFPLVKYASATKPLLDPRTRLIVLTNGGSASASEIVAGAVQDHDRGVIVGSGSGRTYGKGLVQTITPLPSDAALKVTVAFYYTPSGRCIQSVTYKEGGVPVIASGGVDGDMDSDSAAPGGGGGAYSFEATDVLDADRKEFRTDNGRVVRDGGGIEADVRVALPKMSTLEGTLQGLGAYFDYAGVWSRSHEFTQTGDVVNDATLQDFKHWVLEKQKDGEYRLDAAFEPSVRRLEKDLTSLGMEDIAQKQVAPLRARIAEEVAKDFVTRKEYIREELTNAILARYLPESMLLKEQLGTDEQFKVALAVAQDPKRYSVLLEPPSLPENSKSQE